MLVVNRFRVEDDDFGARVDAAVAVLATKPGFVAAQHGRNLDEPDLWVLVTTWENVGSYRRALGAYDTKVVLASLMDAWVHEPSAFADPAEH